MNNVAIIDNEYKNITGIGVKKIKLGGLQLENLRKTVKDSLIQPKKEIEMPKENVETISRMYAEPKEMPKLEQEETFNFAYNGTKKEENIDTDKLKAIKELENTYKGHRTSKEILNKEEIETEENSIDTIKITIEMFDKELNKESYSPKTSEFKNKVGVIYENHKRKIKEQEEKIEFITKEYGKESELSTRLQEDKKDIQNVLKGMNAWNMDFFAKFKDDEETKSLLDHMDKYFGRFGKVLEQKIHEDKDTTARKGNLGNRELEARENLSVYKRQLTEFIQKEYPHLVKTNEQDAKLKETDEEITELTGIKEQVTESPLHLNIEPSVPDIPKLNLEKTTTEQKKPNIFDAIKQSSPDTTINSNSNREPVIGINSYFNPEQEEYSSFGRVA